MARLLTLAALAGVAALFTVSTTQANEGEQAAATTAPAVSQAPAAAAAPAPATTTTRAVAPRRTYRTYSYNPGSVNYYRGPRARAYSYGVRDAASKSLGVYQPFNR